MDYSMSEAEEVAYEEYLEAHWRNDTLNSLDALRSNLDSNHDQGHLLVALVHQYYSRGMDSHSDKDWQIMHWLDAHFQGYCKINDGI